MIPTAAVVLCFAGAAWAQNEAEPASSAAGPSVSFESQSGGTASIEPKPAGKISFNFRYAPWSEVLKLFAETAGLTLDLNDVPPGTFNYFDQGAYTPTEALDILNGYLLQKGYVLVRRDKFLVSLNIDNPIPPNLIPNITVEELPQRGKNELMSLVIPLEGVDAAQVATEVANLLGPQGKAAPLATSNAIVVTDIGSNLQRVYSLLKQVSGAGGTDGLTFRSFGLQHVSAAEAERMVRELLGLSRSVANVSANRTDFSSQFDRFRGGRDRDDGGRDRRSFTPPAAPATTASKAQVAADARTNSLLVTATLAELKIVEEVIKSVDVNLDGSNGRTAGSTAPFLRVYTVSSSDPTEVTKTLDAMMPGLVVNEDGRARKIHIFATPDEHRQVEELIRQLDGVGGSQSVAVIPLSRLDAVSAASTIRSLFLRDGDQAPTIEADSGGRRLLVRGSTDQVAQVKTLLSQLGEDGTGARNTLGQGNVRMLPLNGRDQDEFLRLLDSVWSASSEHPLRIVVPRDPAIIRERLTPNPPETPRTERSSRPQRNESSRSDFETRRESNNAFHVRPASMLLTEEQTDEAEAQPIENVAESEPTTAAPVEVAQPDVKQPSVEQPQSNAEAVVPEAPATTPNNENAKGANAAPVGITSLNGNLILSSQDEAALDRLEQLIERLYETMPNKASWTVFYLRSSDATATAAMLEQLFPASSVARVNASSSGGLFGSLGGGISSISNSIMDASGLTSLTTGPQILRIIPDLRTNSLFVTGPPEQVRDVEQVLKVLDGTDLPGSLRDRVPRFIPVEYADVNEVAQIVRDVYKDYMEDPNAGGNERGRGGDNPFAMMMGGRRNDDRNNNAPTAVKLTVGVDTRTSQLIVSSDDAVFQQIEDLVANLDESARAANRTVRVIQLESANTAIVQQSLGQLLPNVKVSTTGTTRTSTTSGTSSSQPSTSASTSSSSEGDRDAMRRFFEQRMRERFSQDGGRGGDRGGDRGGRSEGDRGGDRRGGGGFGGFRSRSRDGGSGR